jgi:hypothetical protein
MDNNNNKHIDVTTLRNLVWQAINKDIALEQEYWKSDCEGFLAFLLTYEGDREAFHKKLGIREDPKKKGYFYYSS